MQKSQKRLEIENSIHEAHRSSLETALDMINREFGGDLERALKDEDFIERMQKKAIKSFRKYREGYNELEELEIEEDFVAIKSCVKLLDEISEHLNGREVCYYPFSGTDFYWARIFKKTIFEDLSYDSKEEIPNMWWDKEQYTKENREKIIESLKINEFIPKTSNIEFSCADSNTSVMAEELNNPHTTLIVKGGHDFLGYIKERYSETNLEYGNIITVNISNKTKPVEEKLDRQGYKKISYFKGIKYLLPFSMELRDINIFTK